jgi:hypothetical protein
MLIFVSRNFKAKNGENLALKGLQAKLLKQSTPFFKKSFLHSRLNYLK